MWVYATRTVCARFDRAHWPVRGVTERADRMECQTPLHLPPGRSAIPFLPRRHGGSFRTAEGAIPIRTAGPREVPRTGTMKFDVGTLDRSYVRQKSSQFLSCSKQVIFGGLFRTSHDLADHL